ncbi:Vitamin B12 import ATP-binding protein BtuD [Neobacillus rhizosphaerae]|uniref:Vitamin B12 import ATP-binding protein BtuD n=1 Tax=Neobacillus rhizosphaerae TaxID=2880965 RepID=A0ABM9EMS8_9BACI|nr:ABC transporter ATP-binding protein [Neobacillus rhizosphaerae]CAH2713409.1 Vitamin B12 import ATP-binding protein BtuD [Neobacillus rhizosphaerae]
MRLEKISIQINNDNIINSLDLKINSGEIFVLMGPSGSGKTTLLKGIAGLLPFASGKQTWENGTGTTGLVFQEPRLFPHLTVVENIAFGLRVRGISVKERKAMALNFLKNLQLESLENRYPHQLSGGQQQRVSLGRALILNPDLLLLDEPFASLDTSLRLDLIEWLYELQRNLGFSILWVTHYIDEALSVADRIGIILNGGLQQIGIPSELFQKPASEKIAQFLSLPNRFSRGQWRKWFQYELNGLQTQDRGWIDPKHLQLIDEGNRSGEGNIEEAACIISGFVTKVRPSREGYSITVLADSKSLEVNTTGWKRVPKLKEKIRIRVPFEHIHWYSE